MKHFFNKYEEWILGVSGIILAAVIIAMSSWTVERISKDLGRALSSGRENQGKLDFNIEELQGMNLRGLSDSGL